MLGDSVWIWMKRGVFRFIKGQTHDNTSWNVNMSLTFNKPILTVYRSNIHTTVKHTPDIEGFAYKSTNSRQIGMLS